MSSEYQEVVDLIKEYKDSYKNKWMLREKYFEAMDKHKEVKDRLFKAVQKADSIYSTYQMKNMLPKSYWITYQYIYRELRKRGYKSSMPSDLKKTKEWILKD